VHQEQFFQVSFLHFKPKAIIGKPKNQILVHKGKDFYVGDEAWAKLGILNLSFPVDHGVVNDFDDMEKIWHHMFYNELRVAPDEHPLVMSEEITNTKDKRERTAQVMFEKFDVPAFYLEQSSALSLYASGRTTGTVLSMGHTKNDVCCIFEGSVLPNAEVSLFGGRDLTEYLTKKLNENSYSFKTRAEKMYVQEVKEKMCFVLLEPRSEEFTGNREFELPDGNVISLSDEIFMAPEVLFTPSLIGKELSIQELVLNCIRSKDVELQDEFFKNILLSGGGSMFQGIPERIEKELKFYRSNEIKVLDPPERKYSTWIGASILSSLSTFKDKYITKEEFHEFGGRILNYQCFNNVHSLHRIQELDSIFQMLTKMMANSKLTEINFSFD
jgi:actin, other eukaryote